jgi:hypothetical protein
VNGYHGLRTRRSQRGQGCDGKAQHGEQHDPEDETQQYHAEIIDSN